MIELDIVKTRGKKRTWTGHFLANTYWDVAVMYSLRSRSPNKNSQRYQSFFFIFFCNFFSLPKVRVSFHTARPQATRKVSQETSDLGT